MNERSIPERGSLILCRKLPKIISKDAQILPITEALSHFWLRGLAGIICIAMRCIYQKTQKLII